LIEEGFDVVIHVGASPAYLNDSNLPLLKPNDLLQHRCLYMNSMSERPQWRLHHNGRTREIDFISAFSCDNYHVLQQLAVGGLGITQLPDYMNKSQLEDGRTQGVRNSEHSR